MGEVGRKSGFVDDDAGRVTVCEKNCRGKSHGVRENSELTHDLSILG